MKADVAHRELLADGFVNLGKLIPEDHIETLQRQAESLLDQQQPDSWNNYVAHARAGRWKAQLFGEAGRNTNLLDFPGLCPELDRIIDRVLGNSVLQTLLTRILGEGYRIWTAQIRRAEVNARPLRMHQDKRGEIGLGILLSDVLDLDGTTVFVKGSHRGPLEIGVQNGPTSGV